MRAWEKKAGFPRGDQVIFPMDDALLRAAVVLNETGMLFSTMYFCQGRRKTGRESCPGRDLVGEF